MCLHGVGIFYSESVCISRNPDFQFVRASLNFTSVYVIVAPGKVYKAQIATEIFDSLRSLEQQKYRQAIKNRIYINRGSKTFDT